MGNERLYDLIFAEAKGLAQNMLVQRKRLRSLLRMSMGEDLSAVLENVTPRDIENGKKLEDVPDFNSMVERHKLSATTSLDFAATVHAYEKLYEVSPVELTEDILTIFRQAITKHKRSYFSSILVYDYLVDGKLERAEYMLAEYKKTLDEISKDKSVNESDFFKANDSSYKRLEFELRNIAEIKQMHEEKADEIRGVLPEFPNDAGDVELTLCEENLGKGYEMVKSIRYQEVLLDALTRIYDRFKESDEGK